MEASPMTVPTNPLWRQLEQTPEAHGLSVKELVAKVCSGGVRLPRFQRPLRWQAKDVVALFDSLLRGYPVGALMFWQRRAEADPHLPLGGSTIAVPEASDAWWIVDGQQRVTALVAGVLDLDHGRDRRWRVYFDVERASFHTGPVPLDRLGIALAVPTLFDAKAMHKWLRLHDLTDEQQELVVTAHDRLTASRLNAYVLKGADEQALRAVFARTNSAGARMRSDEVFQALMGRGDPITAAGGGAPARPVLDLGLLAAACDADGFGAPPRAEVQKAALAVAGLDPVRRFERLSDDELLKLPDAAELEAALRAAVSFLQRPTDDGVEPGAEIPAYAFLPYPVVFVILTKWFYHHPSPERTARIRLSRWLWRGAASGAHERAAVSMMRLQVRAIKGDDMEADLAALERAVRPVARIDWELRPFHAHSARSRIELLTLLARQPVDGDDKPVDWRGALSSGDRLAREIIASGQWERLSPPAQALARTAANRALLTDRHSGLRVVLRDWRGAGREAALDSHLLHAQQIDLLSADDPNGWAEVLERRAARLNLAVSQLLSRRAGVGEPELRPRGHYFERVDEPDVLLDDPGDPLGEPPLLCADGAPLRAVALGGAGR
jgi:hypothetical protein